MTHILACGIDFGTSNSTCALSDVSGTRLIPLEGDALTLPSAMFFPKGAPLFGRTAIDAYIDGEEGRLMRSLKSILGTSLMDDRTLINNKKYSFVELLTIYIKHLKTAADCAAGGGIENVVLGRPVHFHDNDAAADRCAQDTLEAIAKSLGFKSIAFQYEPIAAAFAHEKDVEGEKLSLVVDLGGGTSDFTIIKISKDNAMRSDRTDDILSTSGIRVGGTNFDQRLSMDSFMPFLGLGSQYRGEFDEGKILDMPSTVYTNLSDWSRAHHAQSAAAIRETKVLLRKAIDPAKLKLLLSVQEQYLGHAILQNVENTKIALTHQDTAEARLPGDLSNIALTVSKKQFEQSISALTQRIVIAIRDCLADAGVSKDQIELVILTGGSTELPLINQMIENEFPEVEIARKDKFGSVGLGLAQHAGRIF